MWCVVMSWMNRDDNNKQTNKQTNKQPSESQSSERSCPVQAERESSRDSTVNCTLYTVVDLFTSLTALYILQTTAQSKKRIVWLVRGSNSGPSACKANVVTDSTNQPGGVGTQFRSITRTCWKSQSSSPPHRQNSQRCEDNWRAIWLVRFED
jgi:hypothetical protein